MRERLRAGAVALLITSLEACGSGSSPSDASLDARAEAAVDASADARTDGAVADPCATVPATGRAPTFTRLSAPVEVLRDEMGVPHLYAANDEDLFYASGYTQAVDRLFQMEVMRRSARGTLAALLGREKLDQDRIVRLGGVARWGHESALRVARERPDVHRLLDAWVAGVNRRIAEVNADPSLLPPGLRSTEYDTRPEPWTVDDPYLLSRLLNFQNANQLDYDLLASVIAGLLPEAGALPLTRTLTDAFIVPPEERPASASMARRSPSPSVRTRRPRNAPPRPSTAPPGALAHRDAALPSPALRERLTAMLTGAAPIEHGASNNWVIAGRHSANGRPMIAGDPHQPIRTPTVFWAQHMNSADRGGTFDVMGFAFAGAPGVHLGHNRRVAWTATTAYPDTMDLWRVGYDGASITLAGRSYPVTRCVERIAVRGEAAVDYEIERVEGHGVLLPRSLVPVPITSGQERILFNWTGFRATDEAVMFFTLDRAPDVDSFDRAVQTSEIGSFNFLVADARDIAYRSRVLLPDRGRVRDDARPNAMLDGSDPSTVWSDRFIATEQQPHSRGGARGFLATANNDPFGFNGNGRVSDDPFYYGTWFDPGSRAARIERELTRLTTRGSVTVAEMQSLQLDTYNLFADELLPHLRTAWAAAADTPALRPLRDNADNAALFALLDGWDRRMDRDASAPVAFEGFQHLLARDVLADDVQLLFDAVIAREPVFMLKVSAHVVNRRFADADRYLQGGRDALMLRALDETRQWLTARFGSASPTAYRWRDWHRTVLGPVFSPAGPFDAGTSQTAGSIGTVNVSQGLFFDGMNPVRFHDSRAGAGYRMVTSFDDAGAPHATVNFVMGNVGDPRSPHWRDQHDDWVEGRYREMPFARADVERASRERSTLMP